MSNLSDDLGCLAADSLEERLGPDALPIAKMAEQHLHRNPLSKILHGGQKLRRADILSWMEFVAIINSGSILFFSDPVSRWAGKDKDVDGNLATLAHLQAKIHTPTSHGADGSFKLRAGSVGARLVLDGPLIAHGNRVTLKRDIVCPLEVGSTTLAKSVVNLAIGTPLARFPYRVAGMEPAVFSFINLAGVETI